MGGTPFFYAVFSVDEAQGALARIQEEQKELDALISELDFKGVLRLRIPPAPSLSRINEEVHRIKTGGDQVRVFHFAGHANSLLVSLAGGDIQGENLRAILKGVDLVVLNGCSTAGHAQFLLDQGVKMVVATSCSVGDKKASLFAQEFYKYLSEGESVAMSYEQAMHVVSNEITDNAFRKVLLKGPDPADDPATGNPWGIYGLEQAETWTLLDLDMRNEALPDDGSLLNKRLLRLNFNDHRSRIRQAVYSKIAPACAMIVHGEQQYGQSWITCNLLEYYLVKYQLSMDSQVIELGERISSAPELLEELLRWRGVEERPNAQQSITALGKNLVKALKTQPLSIHCTKASWLATEPDLLRELVESVWQPLVDVLKLEQSKDEAWRSWKKLWFFLVDEEQEIDLDHPCISDDLEYAMLKSRVLLLPKLPAIVPDDFRFWITDEGNSQSPPYILDSKFSQCLNSPATLKSYFDADETKAPVNFMEDICSRFDCRFERDNDHYGPWIVKNNEEEETGGEFHF